ncbi:MAG: hypothetical protein ABG776_15500, partial [Cyanobacteria bacterium J06555_13]
MTATALAIPQDCSLPDWLSSCLLEHGTSDETSQAIAKLESAVEESPTLDIVCYFFECGALF